MKKGILLAILFIVLLSIPSALAVININKPNTIYSLGDNLKVNINILELNSFTGWINLNLNCGSVTTLLHREIINVTDGEKLIINAPALPLSEKWIGNCFVEVLIEDLGGNEINSTTTDQFLVTDKVNVTAELEKEHFLPGETIKVSGNAVKLNNKAIEGVAVLRLEEGHPIAIKKGFFNGEIKIKENMRSGKHNLIISVNDDFENNGEIIKEISITPVPTDLIVGVDNNTLLPKDTIKIIPILYDQGKDKVVDSIAISIYSPEGEMVFEGFVQSDKEIEYAFPRAAMYGDWKILAESSGLEAEELVYMQRQEEAEITIVGDVLYIQNIGNVPYSEEIELTFKQNDSSITKVENVSLDVGEDISYMLKAPEGYYNVNIEGRDVEKTFKNIPLTGKVIEVEDLSKSNAGSWIRNIVLIIALVFISTIATTKIRTKILELRKKDPFRKEEDSVYRYIQDMKNKGISNREPEPLKSEDDDVDYNSSSDDSSENKDDKEDYDLGTSLGNVFGDD